MSENQQENQPLQVTDLLNTSVSAAPRPSLLRQPTNFTPKNTGPKAMTSEFKENALPTNIRPADDEHFEVFKRKPDDVNTSIVRPPNKIRKTTEQPIQTRKPLGARTNTRDTSLAASNNNFSTSLRSSTMTNRLNQSMRITSSSKLDTSIIRPPPASRKPAPQPAATARRPVTTTTATTTANKQQNDEIYTRLAGLESQFSSQNVRVASLEGLLAAEKEKVSTIHETKVNLEGALDVQRGDSDKLRTRIRELMDQNDEASNQTRQLSQAIDRMRDDHHRQLSDKDYEIQRVQRNFDAERANLTAARIELDTLKNTISTQSAQISSMESQALGLNSRLTASENLCAEKAARIEQLLGRVRELEETVGNLEEKSREDEDARRKLHNQIQELKGNIRVFCRVRPSLSNDAPASSSDETIPTYVYPAGSDNKSLDINFNSGVSVSGKAGQAKKMSFQFDKVFPPSSNQSQVFQEISQLVQSVLDGYNTCIFTYGQTGSGKTFTMEGPAHSMENASYGVVRDENRGMIPRTVEQIFTTAKNLENKGWKFQMEAYFLEIYNETIRDLLSKDPEAKLDIKQNPQDNSVYVPGLKTIKVEDPGDVYRLLSKAAKNRAVARTNCNERSSRSHSVFQLKLIGHNTITEEKRSSVLNLIDLAGSERLSQSGATGDRLKETQNINKSLSALGDVIFKLSEKAAHIPFRNSKLTHLLSNCLGGQSKTLMFVNISPQAKDFAETLSSLRFATKVNNCEIGTARKQVE